MTKLLYTNRLQYLLIILFFLIPGINLSASNFIGIGAGTGISKTSTDKKDDTCMRIPVVAEYEYSSEYRNLWLLNASVNYLPGMKDGYTGDVFLFSAGIKYIPQFYFYRSNITESLLKKDNCLGILLLPVTMTRDAMNNISQYGIPTHPFLLLDYTIIKAEEKIYYTGFTAGAGITSGMIDITLKYTQNIRYDRGFRKNFYFAGIDFTLHIPLQEKFLEEKPLVE